MENNLIMTPHLISALANLISEYGDTPVFIGDKDSTNAMVPVTYTYPIEVSKPGIKPEKAILIANFGMVDDCECCNEEE